MPSSNASHCMKQLKNRRHPILGAVSGAARRNRDLHRERGRER